MVKSWRRVKHFFFRTQSSLIWPFFDLSYRFRNLFERMVSDPCIRVIPHFCYWRRKMQLNLSVINLANFSPEIDNLYLVSLMESNVTAFWSLFHRFKFQFERTEFLVSFTLRLASVFFFFLGNTILSFNRFNLKYNKTKVMENL